MNKEDREKEQLLKEQVLYDLLFNKKVDKLGNLTVQQRDGFVVVDSGGKIVFVWKNVKAKAHAAAVLEKVKELVL